MGGRSDKARTSLNRPPDLICSGSASDLAPWAQSCAPRKPRSQPPTPSIPTSPAMSLRLLAARPSALSPSISLLASTSRGYATPAGPAPPSRAEQKRKMDELQAKQVKLAEKAGRMKQNSQVVSLAHS